MMIILFSLSSTQNCMSLSSHYPQKIIKNYQNHLAKDLKDQCIGMNIKQKVRIKLRQTSIDISWIQTLHEITDFLFWFIQIKITVQKGVKP